jgi:hypothetical protein
MNYMTKKDQVTVCKKDICITVVGELAKVLAFVAIVGIAVNAAAQLVKVFK